MALSNASINHHEQLGTISWPLSFNNRAEETVSRRNALTAIFHRIFQALVNILTSLLCSAKKPHDATNGLESLLLRADRYSRNLNGEIDHDAYHAITSTSNSIIYQGILRPSGTRVAVKTTSTRCRPDSEMVKRTLREVHIWSKLHHDNILPLLGIITAPGGTVSMVTEWMTRGNAYDYVQDINVDPRPLVLDIAQGIFYLHTHASGPIFHGDLKGMNVLISPEGRALLTDFGYSHLTTSSFSMTMDTPCGGTWNWLAPEILVSEEYPVTLPRDIWAFGMTVLELFSQKKPFSDKRNGGCVLWRIVFGPLPERPSDECTRSRMTDPWWNLCILCWERNPLSRPAISDLMVVIERLH